MIRYRCLRDGKEVSNWTLEENGKDGKYYEPCFGKQERTLKESDAILQGEDISKAISVEQLPSQLTGELENWVTLPAEYTIEEEDMAAELAMLAQQAANSVHLAYLASTDWYIIREQETGIACPQEIKDARAAARAAIIRS